MGKSSRSRRRGTRERKPSRRGGPRAGWPSGTGNPWARLQNDLLLNIGGAPFLDYRDDLRQPPRIGERIAIPIAKLLTPLLPGTYRPVRARAVALSLVKTVPTAKGVVVLASNVLAQIGGEH